jgi:hypothetical protein
MVPAAAVASEYASDVDVDTDDEDIENIIPGIS